MRSSARPPQVLGNQPLGHRSTNITPSSNNRQSRQSTIVSASQQYQQDQNGGHSTTQDVDIREENEKFARGMKRLRSTPMCSSSWQYKENASRFHAMQEDLRARAALRRSRLDHGHRTDLSLQEANVEISPARGSTNRAPDAYGDSSVHGYQAPSFEYQAHAGYDPQVQSPYYGIDRAHQTLGPSVGPSSALSMPQMYSANTMAAPPNESPWCSSGGDMPTQPKRMLGPWPSPMMGLQSYTMLPRQWQDFPDCVPQNIPITRSRDAWLVTIRIQ